MLIETGSPSGASKSPSNHPKRICLAASARSPRHSWRIISIAAHGVATWRSNVLPQACHLLCSHTHALSTWLGRLALLALAHVLLAAEAHACAVAFQLTAATKVNFQPGGDQILRHVFHVLTGSASFHCTSKCAAANLFSTGLCHGFENAHSARTHSSCRGTRYGRVC